MRKWGDMIDVGAIRINVLRQRVYDQILEELKEKFEASEYAGEYSVRYNITTDRIPEDIDESLYYDELQIEDLKGTAVQEEINHLNFQANNHIEQSIYNIYEYAYPEMNEYLEIVRIIEQELSRLIIIPEVTKERIRSVIKQRLQVFEQLNNQGFIRDKKEIAEYINQIKNLDYESKDVVNKISKSDIKFIAFGFHDVIPNDYTVSLTQQISYGNPSINLIDYTLAVVLIFISYGVKFHVDGQGTQRQSNKETQITSFARFIKALVNTNNNHLNRKEISLLLEGIVKHVTAKSDNAHIVDVVKKVKESIVRTNMHVSSLEIITEYFQPSNMFGFTRLTNSNNISAIAKKTTETLNLLKDVYVLDKNYFHNNPLKYLNRYINRD